MKAYGHIAIAGGQNDGALRWRELTPELDGIGAAWSGHLWTMWTMWTMILNRCRNANAGAFRAIHTYIYVDYKIRK